MDKFDIDPLKVFNIWFIFRPSRNYKLIDTVDLDIDFDVDDFKAILKHNRTMGSFVLIQEMGRKVLEEVKNAELDREYDAVAWCHVTALPKEKKITVSVDCFNKRRWYRWW